MKRPGLPPRRAWIRRSTAPKKRRKPSEFARIYGSRKRVAWVKSQPCIACNATPCENAHTKNGGMGRKAGYETIVPLCHVHHRELHCIGAPWFQDRHHLSLDYRAAATQAAWLTATGGAA